MSCMSAKKLRPLSPIEWLLMRSIWDLGGADPPDVAEHLRSHYERSDLGKKTVGILLRRLVTKGYLCSSPRPVVRGRPPHVYSPLIGPEDAFELLVEKFLQDHKIDEKALFDALERREFSGKHYSG